MKEIMLVEDVTLLLFPEAGNLSINRKASASAKQEPYVHPSLPRDNVEERYVSTRAMNHG